MQQNVEHILCLTHLYIFVIWYNFGDIGNAILPGDDRNRTMTFCLACEYLSGII